MTIPTEVAILERPAAKDSQALELLRAAFPHDAESGLLKVAAVRMGPVLTRALHAERETARAELETDEARLRAWGEKLQQQQDDLDAWDHRNHQREGELATWELTLREQQAAFDALVQMGMRVEADQEPETGLNAPPIARVAALLTILFAVGALAAVSYWLR